MKPLLSQKLKNAVVKAGGDNYVFSLENILINGDKRGCSGHIRNKQNGAVLYIKAENDMGGVAPSWGWLLRFAFNEEDWGGVHSYNRFSECDVDEYAQNIVEMLDETQRFEEWNRENAQKGYSRAAGKRTKKALAAASV